jgi:hypothetical protein
MLVVGAFVLGLPFLSVRMVPPPLHVAAATGRIKRVDKFFSEPGFQLSQFVEFAPYAPGEFYRCYCAGS